MICTCAPVRDFTGLEVARVGLFEHARDDESIVTEHNRGAWERRAPTGHLGGLEWGFQSGQEEWNPMTRANP